MNKAMVERDYPSDTDRTRSVSPPIKATPNMRINTLLNDEAPMSTPTSHKGGGRSHWSSRTKTGTGGPRSFRSKLEGGAQDAQSPSGNAPTFSGPHGFYLPLNGSDPAHKRTRPLTQHQLAVEQYRRRRVDVILDLVGGDYLARDVDALAVGGRIMVIAAQGGRDATIDVGRLMTKRARIWGTTLRARPLEERREIMAQVREHVWPLVAAGTVRPVLDSVYPLEFAATAHKRMESGQHLGKIVLAVR